MWSIRINPVEVRSVESVAEAVRVKVLATKAEASMRIAAAGYSDIKQRNAALVLGLGEDRGLMTLAEARTVAAGVEAIVLVQRSLEAAIEAIASELGASDDEKIALIDAVDWPVVEA